MDKPYILNPPAKTEPYLEAIVGYWNKMYTAAEEDRRDFMKLGDECQEFFTGNGRRFWGAEAAAGGTRAGVTENSGGYFSDGFARPKFCMWIAKAFEFVSVIGPQLFWQSPRRLVSPRFVKTPSDQLLQFMGMINPQLSQQALEMHAADYVPSQVRCQITEQALNATSTYGVGLAANSELSIIEMMIRGRGLLEPYVMELPGADGRQITGLKHLSIRHLFIDPDCRECTLDSAKYIIITRREPWWEVERKFNLPRGYMRDKTSSTSEVGKAATYTVVGGGDTAQVNQSKDMIEYMEVYSKMGIGGQHMVEYDSVTQTMSNVVGDYVYLAICPSVKHPLNVPPNVPLSSLDDDALRAMFAWKTPHWKSQRWPIAVLDCHPLPGTPYPLPIFSQVIGELVALNVLSSVLVTRGHATSQEIIGVLGEYEQQVKNSIASGASPAYVKVMADTGRSINDVVAFLQRPDLTNSLMSAIQWLQDAIEKKTGLVPHQYAMQSGSAARSATDVQLRDEKASIRPEHMRRQIAEWQTVAAQLELTEMITHLGAEDVEPMIGQLAAMAWMQLIESAEDDSLAQSLQCSVEASDMERPNKPRQAELLQSLSNVIVPAIERYGQTYGNYVPFNKYVASLGHLVEIDTTEFELPPPPQPSQEEPSPEQQQMQQLALEVEQRKMTADATMAEAKAQKAVVDAQVAQDHGAAKVAGAQQKLQIDNDMATVKAMTALATIRGTEVIE